VAQVGAIQASVAQVGATQLGSWDIRFG